MPTQKHHDWMKSYFKMLGYGQSAAQPAAASTQSSAPTAANDMSSEKDESDADQGMSLATGGQATGQSAADAGVSLSTPAPPAPAAAQKPESDGGAQTPEGEKPAQPASAGSFTINEKVPPMEGPQIPFAGGRFKAKFTVGFVVQGTAEHSSAEEGGEEKGEKTTVGGTFGNEGKKKDIAFAVAHAWIDKEGVKAFGFDTHLVEIQPKAEFAVGTNGVEVSCEAAGKLGCGAEVSVKATLIGTETGSPQPKICTLTVGGSVPLIQVPETSVLGIKIHDIKLQLDLKGEIEPQWTMIAKDIAEKFVQRTVGVAAFDVAVTGGLVVAAFGVIPASLSQLVAGDDVESAGKIVNDTTDALMDGYRLGVTGDQAPGDAIAVLGYQAGSNVFNQGLAIVKQKVPDASDEVIKAWISEIVDKNELVKKAHDQFLDMAADAAWKHYKEKYSYSRFYLMNAYNKIYPEKEGKYDDPVFKNAKN